MNTKDQSDKPQIRLDSEATDSQLELFTINLKKEILSELISYGKTVLWVCAAILALGTLGGVYSLRGLIEQRVDEAINDKSAEYQRISDRAIEDVIELRVKTNAALNDTKVIEQSMAREVEKAKRLILETTRYWEAVKPAIENVENLPRPDNNFEPESKGTAQLMKCLRHAGVTDPDVSLFLAVIENNIDAVKEAMDSGGNPVVTVEDILARHSDIVAQSCSKFTP